MQFWRVGIYFFYLLALLLHQLLIQQLLSSLYQVWMYHYNHISLTFNRSLNRKMLFGYLRYTFPVNHHLFQPIFVLNFDG